MPNHMDRSQEYRRQMSIQRMLDAHRVDIDRLKTLAAAAAGGGGGSVTLTGDVTGTGTGTVAATIANDSVTNAKLADMAESRIKGRAAGAGTGDPTDLTPNQIRALINVADGANAYTHPNHTGDVTSTGDGATVIAADAVTNAKAANMAEATLKGRAAAAGTGDPTDLTATQARTLLNVADGADATGATITALATKNPPVDADAVVITDSAASGAPKRVTFTDLKSFLATYFNTLYVTAADLTTHAALTAAHGTTGAVVGTTDTQTLTNKTLTSPTINFPAIGAAHWSGATHTHQDLTTGGQLAGGAITNGVLTNAKLADMAESRIKGRAAAAGTGAPVDLTAAEVVTILGVGQLTSNNTWTQPNTFSVRVIASQIRAIDAGGLRLLDDGSNVGLFVDDGAFVGMGTVSPEGRAHVVGTTVDNSVLLERAGLSSDDMFVSMRLLATKTSNMIDGFGTAMRFSARDDAGVINGLGDIGAVRDGADNSGALVFSTMAAGSITKRMRITSAGLVGIGLDAPQGRLHMHDGTAGHLFVTKTGITGTVQTIIPNGSGDVTRRLNYRGLIATPSAINRIETVEPTPTLIPGAEDLLSPDSGTNVYALRVNADGSVDVRRTTGTASGTIALELFWI